MGDLSDLESVASIAKRALPKTAKDVAASQKRGAKEAKGPTAREQRLLAAQQAHDVKIQHIHSVLAQTSMPYRDPKDMLHWKRRNGEVFLEMSAGRALDRERDDFRDVGLPFGPKARLILAHLSTEALRSSDPHINTEDTLTRFMNKALGLDINGRSIASVRDQMARLAACSIRLGMFGDHSTVQVQSHLVSGFDLWQTGSGEQRALWPTAIKLSPDYFASLQEHAVPLNESHLRALSHSAMGLDIYTWLTQRFRRVRYGEKSLIPWASLHGQFGADYERVRKFREVFNLTLDQVLTVYKAARTERNAEGLLLLPSPSPVPPDVKVGPWR